MEPKGRGRHTTWLHSCGKSLASLVSSTTMALPVHWRLRRCTLFGACIMPVV